MQSGSKTTRKSRRGRRGRKIRRYSRPPFAGEVSGRPKPLAQRADRTEDFGRASRRLSERREAGTGSTAARTARCLSMDLCSLAGVGSPYLTRTHQEREIEEAQRGLPGCERRVRAERYRSGQTGQTVNLLANAFGGSNPPLSTTRVSSAGQRCKEMVAAANEWTAGIAQLARARAFQARGRGFESRFPLHARRSVIEAESRTGNRSERKGARAKSWAR